MIDVGRCIADSFPCRRRCAWQFACPRRWLGREVIGERTAQPAVGCKADILHEDLFRLFPEASSPALELTICDMLRIEVGGKFAGPMNRRGTSDAVPHPDGTHGFDFAELTWKRLVEFSSQRLGQLTRAPAGLFFDRGSVARQCHQTHDRQHEHRQENQRELEPERRRGGLARGHERRRFGRGFADEFASRPEQTEGHHQPTCERKPPSTVLPLGLVPI